MKRFKNIQYYLVWIVIIALLGVGLARIGRIVWLADLQDFDLYYHGAQQVLERENPYIIQGVIYPPIALILLSPLAELSLPVAENIWTVLSVVCLAGTILVINNASGDRLSLKTRLLIGGLSLFSFPILFTLGMGQINLLLLFLITLSFYWYREKETIGAGMALAVAASLKLTPLVLVLFYVRKRRWGIAATAIIGFLVLQLLGVALLGWLITSQFWLSVFPDIPTIGNAIYYNQSLAGFLARLGISNSLALGLNLLVFASLLLLAWKVTSKTTTTAIRELLEFSLLLLVILIGGGLVWQHHLVTTLVPNIALIIYWRRKEGVPNWNWLVFAVLMVAISWNIKQPAVFDGWQQLVLSHGLFGTIGLFLLVFMQLRSRPTNAAK